MSKELKTIGFSLMFLLSSCDSPFPLKIYEADGHIYIFHHGEWVHDTNCGKCKELNLKYNKNE